MIKLTSISVQFGLNLVLNNLSGTIKAGDFITIVGTNGAGKTTFFDLIAGKIKPTYGIITIDGHDMASISEKERSIYISRLFQNPSLNCVSNMTVAENIALALCKGQRITLKKPLNHLVQEKLNEIAQLFGFDAKILGNKLMGSLSGGQRQTISLVLTTLIKPKILLLDEPTAALDPQAATKMLRFAVDYIRQHKLTTIMITHDPNLALTLGSKIWILDKGHITKEINQKEKAIISASDLIGQIDYEALS